MARRAQRIQRTLLTTYSLVGLLVTFAMAAVLGYVMQKDLTDEELRSSSEMAAHQVAKVIGHHITPSDLARGMSPQAQERLDQLVRADLRSGDVVRVKLWNRSGTVVYSDSDAAMGMSNPSDPAFRRALGGQTVAEVLVTAESNHATEQQWTRLLEIHVPLRLDGSDEILGVYEIYRTTDSLAQRIAEIRATIAVGVFGGFAVLYVALFGVVLGASRSLVKRSEENERLGVDLGHANERLEGALKSVTTTMGKLAEARDPYTQGHEQRVSELATRIASEMGLSARDVEAIEIAALIHDIGKLSVPTEILCKPSRLSEMEFALIKEHPQSGFDILKDVDFDWPIADIVLQHHERMDGSGYPNGLAGKDTLMAARVIAVADVVEAMASYRPYRPALGMDAAIAEIKDHPEQFDPEVTAACLRLHETGRIGL